MAHPTLTRIFSLNLNLLMTALGGVLLGVLIFHLGPGAVLEHLGRIGPGWLSLNGQEILVSLAKTGGWNYCFPPENRTVAFWDLLKIRLVGEGLNYLVPTAIAGEIWRISSLRRSMPSTRGAASVAVAKFNLFSGALFFITLGLLFAAPHAPLRPGLTPWLWAALALCLLMLAMFYLSLRHRAFEKFAARLQNWLPAQVYAYLPAHQIEEADDFIAAYLAADRRSLLASMSFYTLGWALGLVEVALIFYFLRLPLDPATLVMVETLSILLDIGLFFLPIKLGTQEGGRVLIFIALGLPPASGLSFAIVRRIKDLTWAGIGLGLMQTLPSPLLRPDVGHSAANPISPPGGPQ